MWRYLLKKAFFRIYLINNNNVNNNDISLLIKHYIHKNNAL